MCRATAGPLLAMVGVAGTAAGVAIAIVRERVDRRADARAARQAAKDQDSQIGLRQDDARQDSGEAGADYREPVESDSDDSK